MNEKLLKIFGGVIAGFVVLILILLLISSCGKRKYTYEKLEDEMISVAKRYFEKDESRLPKENEENSYTLDKMIKNGSIGKIEELFDDPKLKCSGEATVLNNNGEYIYSAYLDCGDKYKTSFLKDKIIEDNLVDTGIGLYQVGDQYIMKGEVKNNYITIMGKLYRLIRINNDGSIRVIIDETSLNTVWDNRYNDELKSNTGFNNYVLTNNIDSRIKEKLNNFYNNDRNIPSEAKKYIVVHDVCIGPRNPDDTTKDGSTECSVVTKDQKVSTLSVYEFLSASLDEKCIKTDSRACKNFNWLSKLPNEGWTVTPISDTQSKVYTFDSYINEGNCNSTSTAYVVFNIYSKVKYISGDGTYDNPYKFIKYDE